LKPIMIAYPGQELWVERFCREFDIEGGRCTVRHFPDGEAYVRLNSDVAAKQLIILCSLDQPDKKILPLLFLAETARELGATRIGLLAPYLSYMRQDARFHSGEAISAHIFARLIDPRFDWLITLDPHLHRFDDLREVYTIPSYTATAVQVIANWIRANVQQPYLIGPDMESDQWARRIAQIIDIPFTILHKTRHGDREVEVSPPDLSLIGDRTPVIIDDIISTGKTMCSALGHLKNLVARAPVCIGIHAVFSPGAIEDLHEAGAARIVSCNTIEHETNKIDIAHPLFDALRHLGELE